MAVAAKYLADTSALARMKVDTVNAVLDPLIRAGLVGTCGVIEFELGWATRSPEQLARLTDDRRTGYEWLPTLDRDWTRALTVHQSLWSRGQMRAVGFPDLLIAAVAEREAVTIIHYDADYELISAVTGQATRWVVPRGSV